MEHNEMDHRLQPDAADELETWMDAQADQPSADHDDPEEAIALSILHLCEGVDDVGLPSVTIAMTLEKYNPDNNRYTSIAQMTLYEPILSVNARQNFLELTLTFPKADSSNLKVLWSHLENYRELEAQQSITDSELILFSLVLVPIGGLGTSYMIATNPIIWYVQPSTLGGELNQIRLLLHAEDLRFYQTDEIDLEEVDAIAQRNLMAQDEALAEADKKEAERQAAQQKSEEIAKSFRKF
jgi:hypothetical protein